MPTILKSTDHPCWNLIKCGVIHSGGTGVTWEHDVGAVPVTKSQEGSLFLLPKAFNDGVSATRDRALIRALQLALAGQVAPFSDETKQAVSAAIIESGTQLDLDRIDQMVDGWIPVTMKGTIPNINLWSKLDGQPGWLIYDTQLAP